MSLVHINIIIAFTISLIGLLIDGSHLISSLLEGWDLGEWLGEKLSAGSRLSSMGAGQLLETPGACSGTWICRVICLRSGSVQHHCVPGRKQNSRLPAWCGHGQTLSLLGLLQPPSFLLKPENRFLKLVVLI